MQKCRKIISMHFRKLTVPSNRFDEFLELPVYEEQKSAEIRDWFNWRLFGHTSGNNIRDAVSFGYYDLLKRHPVNEARSRAPIVLCRWVEFSSMLLPENLLCAITYFPISLSPSLRRSSARLKSLYTVKKKNISRKLVGVAGSRKEARGPEEIAYSTEQSSC